MEDHIVPPPNTKEEPPSNFLKYALLTLGALTVLIAVGGGSYILGTKSARVEPSPTNAPLAQQPATKPSTLGIEADSNDNLDATGSASPSANPKISPSPTPLPKSKILPSIAKLDGFRLSTGSGNSTLDIRAGRNDSSVTRGFVTFDLKGLPAGAKILSATLRLYQAKAEGNPYFSAGDLRVDHLIYGDSLDNMDYSLAALLNQFTTLSKTPKTEWKETDVTQAVKNDVANARPNSQFRIRFMTEVTSDSETGDFVYFESAENYGKTGNLPQLVVKYY